MRIGPHDTGECVLVVAEIGNNHEGDAGMARELVHAAAEAGAGAVKFQTIEPRLLVRPGETERLAQLERFKLSDADFAQLSELAHGLGLAFVSTPFHLDAVETLRPLVDAYKVASGDNDFWPLLERVGRAGLPVIVSSGASSLEHVRRFTAAVRDAGAADVAVLHCVSVYPLDPAAANLAAIGLLREEVGVTVGFSDHTLGIEACLVAAAAGARILEKHFTLDHNLSEFRDHQLSAEPEELAELVRRVEEEAARGLPDDPPEPVRRLLGEPVKRVHENEADVERAMRRSIVAGADLPEGRVLGHGDLLWMRPRDGLAPGREGELTGRALTHAVSFGDPLGPGDVE